MSSRTGGRARDMRARSCVTELSTSVNFSSSTTHKSDPAVISEITASQTVAKSPINNRIGFRMIVIMARNSCLSHTD
jgi:hypothetical protein